MFFSPIQITLCLHKNLVVFFLLLFQLVCIHFLGLLITFSFFKLLKKIYQINYFLKFGQEEVIRSAADHPLPPFCVMKEAMTLVLGLPLIYFFFCGGLNFLNFRLCLCGKKERKSRVNYRLVYLYNTRPYPAYRVTIIFSPTVYYFLAHNFFFFSFKKNSFLFFHPLFSPFFLLLFSYLI